MKEGIHHVELCKEYRRQWRGDTFLSISKMFNTEQERTKFIKIIYIIQIHGINDGRNSGKAMLTMDILNILASHNPCIPHASTADHQVI